MNNVEINLTPTATLLEIEDKIQCRTWGIAPESNAAFLLIHGLGGHSAWFEPIARRLKVKQTFVVAPDLAGFGKRKNDPFVSYRQWVEDAITVFKHVHSMMGDKPVFLLGNSMGALVALEVCQRLRPNGLALLSPAFAGHPKIFTLSYQLPTLFKALIAPDNEIELPYGSDLIAKQESVRTWLDNDEGKRTSVPGRMFIDLFFLTQSLRRRKINLSCPLFMITAGVDSLVNNQSSELIYRQIVATSKKKTIMPKAMHDLTIDPCVDQIADLLIEWANSIMQTNDRIKTASKSGR